MGHDQNGNKVKERRNGNGARVYGVNLDGKIAHGRDAALQVGVINLYSPDDSLNAIFLSNYAYVSLVDPVKRVPGVGDVQVFGEMCIRDRSSSAVWTMVS